jgi:hypothetical protein
VRDGLVEILSIIFLLLLFHIFNQLYLLFIRSGIFPYPHHQNFNAPNRIYVNPNFKGRPQTSTMGKHQQSKETQYGHSAKQSMTAEERARKELLNKKSREAVDGLRRRQEVLL